MHSTPIAQSKSAALSRITDSIPKGYCRFTKGQVKAEKAHKLIEKFHAARSLRKKDGKARKCNGGGVAFVVYAGQT